MKYFLLINIFYLLLFAEEYEKLELHRMCDGGDNCVAISHSYDTDDLQILLEKIPVLEIKKKEISKAYGSEAARDFEKETEDSALKQHNANQKTYVLPAIFGKEGRPMC